MSRSARIIIPILLVALIGGAVLFTMSRHSATQASCASILPQPKIVAFGDSLVAGYGATTEGGFVSLVSTNIGIPITNLGKNGDTTASAEDRLQSVLDAEPDITLVLLGGNDALQRVPQAQTEQNLASIIEQIQKGGSRVILLGVLGGFPDPYSSMYSRLAKDYNVTYVSNVLSGIIGYPDLMSDEVHPNEAGYQKIADRIVPVLEDECSSSQKDH